MFEEIREEELLEVDGGKVVYVNPDEPINAPKN